MARREENKAEKKARIREAAEALFLERGFDGTTVDAVAQRAGVAKGTVFLYAPTKSGLVAMVFEDRVRGVTALALESLPEGLDLLGELEHVFGCIFSMYEATPELARLFVKELVFLDGEAALAARGAETDFLAMLERRVEARRVAGEIRSDVPSHIVALNAFALYLLALQAWLTKMLPDLVTARALLHTSLELMFRGLSPAPSPSVVAEATPKKAGTSWTKPPAPPKPSAKAAPATSRRGASTSRATSPTGSSSSRSPASPSASRTRGSGSGR